MLGRVNALNSKPAQQKWSCAVSAINIIGWRYYFGAKNVPNTQGMNELIWSTQLCVADHHSTGVNIHFFSSSGSQHSKNHPPDCWPRSVLFKILEQKFDDCLTKLQEVLRFIDEPTQHLNLKEIEVIGRIGGVYYLTITLFDAIT